MDKQYAPIILFTYCRPDHTKQVVDALLKNKEASESDLFIYSDAPKNEKAASGVAATRAYIRNIIGFKSISICEREKNWGLANSLIDGITTVINKYGRAIIVEDDIVTSPYFLKYMNEALDRYANDIRVATIHGYMLPIRFPEEVPDAFFSTCHGCWGWATWKENWAALNKDASDLYRQVEERKLKSFLDIDDSNRKTAMLKSQVLGNINSWAIRWHVSNLLLGRLCLHPKQSYVAQIGMDGVSATHSTKTNIFDTPISMKPLNWDNVDLNVTENMLARKCIHDYYKSVWSFGNKIRWFLHITNIEKILVGKKLNRFKWYRD